MSDLLHDAMREINGALIQENEQLKAELEALKPKPFISVCWQEAELIDKGPIVTKAKVVHSGPMSANLKLIFEDGKLIDAEVLR